MYPDEPSIDVDIEDVGVIPGEPSLDVDIEDVSVNPGEPCWKTSGIRSSNICLNNCSILPQLLLMLFCVHRKRLFLLMGELVFSTLQMQNSCLR